MAELAPNPRNATRTQAAFQAQCPYLSTVVSRQHTWVLVLDKNIYNIKTIKGSAEKEMGVFVVGLQDHHAEVVTVPSRGFLPADAQCPLPRLLSLALLHGESGRVSHGSREDESLRVTKAKRKYDWS